MEASPYSAGDEAKSSHCNLEAQSMPALSTFHRHKSNDCTEVGI